MRASRLLPDNRVVDEVAPEGVILKDPTAQVVQPSSVNVSPAIPGSRGGEQQESVECEDESSTDVATCGEVCSNPSWRPPTLEDIQGDPAHELEQALTTLGAGTNAAQGTLISLAAIAPRAGQSLYLKLMGPSSGAKSFTVRQALSLIPPDLPLMSQQVTAAFLARTESLAGRPVILDEAEVDHDVRQIFRLLVSDGEATRNLVIGGEPTTLHIRGPISLIEPHLEDAMFDSQEGSRALTIAVNTGAEAVAESLNSLIDSHCLESYPRRSEHDALRSAFREFYASLDPEIGVEIPRTLLAKIVVRSDRPTILRFHVNLIALLKTAAFLRQHVKPKTRLDGREFVLVDAMDYQAVFSLLQRANPQDDHDELTVKAVEAFTMIRPKLGGESLDVYQISEQTGLSVPQARRRLAELVKAGLMEVTKRGPTTKQLFGLSPFGKRSTWKSLYGQLPAPKELDGV